METRNDGSGPGDTEREKLKAGFRRLGIDHVHYMAPVSTQLLIWELGILSYNGKRAMEREDEAFRQIVQVIHVEAWANPHVQLKRHKRLLGTRSIHDFVPIYFATHTPPQYVVTERDFEDQALNVAFAEVNLERVLDIDGIWFSDGNAASGDTMFYKTASGIDKVRWDIVLGRAPCWSSDFKRIKCAELLVPDRVPTDCIDRLVMLDRSMLDLTRRRLARASEHGFKLTRKVKVRFDRSHFYKMSGGRLVPDV